VGGVQTKSRYETHEAVGSKRPCSGFVFVVQEGVKLVKLHTAAVRNPVS